MSTVGVRAASVQRNKPRGRRVSVVDVMAKHVWPVGTELTSSVWARTWVIMEIVPGEVLLRDPIAGGRNWVRSLPGDVEAVGDGE